VYSLSILEIEDEFSGEEEDKVVAVAQGAQEEEDDGDDVKVDCSRMI